MSDLGVVILAGGTSSRFWPVARQANPKSLLKLDETGKTLIGLTVDRAKRLTQQEHIFVVGHENHQALISNQINQVKYIAEPKTCNTAVAVALAALHLKKHTKDGVMVVLPADHMVLDEKNFQKTIFNATQIALSYDVLVTIGILPTFPHTDYGYIRRGEAIGENCINGHAYVVSRFYEKPNLKRARAYFASDEFYWNSGMFVWRPDVLLEAIKIHMPKLYELLQDVIPVIDTSHEIEVLKKIYEQLEPISIDFGIMEHAKNCVVVEAEQFGWDDVGSWDAWAEHLMADSDENVALGDVSFLDCSGCVVHSDKIFTTLLGVDDIIVVNTQDSLLVCHRDKVTEIKKIVAKLQEKGRKELL